LDQFKPTGTGQFKPTGLTGIHSKTLLKFPVDGFLTGKSSTGFPQQENPQQEFPSGEENYNVLMHNSNVHCTCAVEHIYASSYDYRHVADYKNN